jgi:hypothetical protein
LFIFNSYMLYSEKELNNSKSSRYGWKEGTKKKAAAFFFGTRTFCVFLYPTHIAEFSCLFFIVETMKMFSTRLYFFMYIRIHSTSWTTKKGTAESLYTFMLIYMYGTVRHEEEYKAHSLYAVHCYAMWCDVFLWEPRNIKKWKERQQQQKKVRFEERGEKKVDRSRRSTQKRQ